MHKIFITEKLIEIEGYISAYDVVHPENFYFSGEMHDFWEMVYVKKGKVIATGDERIYNLCEGQIVFHKPLEFHRIWSANGSSPHLNILSFRGSGEILKALKERSFSLSQSDRKLYLEVFDTFAKATSAYNDGGKGSWEYRIISSKASSLLEVFLLGLIGKESLPQIPVSSDEKNYQKIVAVMNEHCKESLSVDDLAALCLMSRSNMKRVFAKFSDLGIAKYFIGLKIRYAMKLLAKGHSPKETSALLGFNEVSYFHTVFKRETGLTPVQYQKQYLQKGEFFL